MVSLSKLNLAPEKPRSKKTGKSAMLTKEDFSKKVVNNI